MTTACMENKQSNLRPHNNAMRHVKVKFSHIPPLKDHHVTVIFVDGKTNKIVGKRTIPIENAGNLSFLKSTFFPNKRVILQPTRNQSLSGTTFNAQYLDSKNIAEPTELKVRLKKRLSSIQY